MTPEKLTQSLKAEASKLQFSLAGCCPAVSPSGYHHFLKWLEAGYAGEMSYLVDRHEAYRHPSSVLPGVKSLLMLTMNYSAVALDDSTPGRIAKYAWGEFDYHDVIHKRLKQLKDFALSCDPEMSVRGVVDTAPLLEREFAQLAGLGWIGKNTLLLNKTQGSYFFLAALLLDRELDYDQPMQTSHCGTCTACLDACPTDAFEAPYVLDASRCISYLTIEHRSAISEDLRPQMDGWMFGCDVCQEVCPWNRMAQGPEVDELKSTPAHQSIDLRELFRLDEDEFRLKFRKTPMWRPRRRGMLRNAAIALAHSPELANVEPLILGAKDSDDLVRGAAIWALSKHLFDSVRDKIHSLAREIKSQTTNQDVKTACDVCLKPSS